MARPTLIPSAKFKRLVYKLALPAPFVLGLLETMWGVADGAGDPRLGDEEGVEIAAEWPVGFPRPAGREVLRRGELFAVLLAEGWIDETRPVGDRSVTATSSARCFEIHDYFDHCADYVRKRLKREQRRKETRAATHSKKKHIPRPVTDRSMSAGDRSVTSTPSTQHPAPNKDHLPTEGASGSAERSARADEKRGGVSAKKPAARYLDIDYGVTFLDRYPDLDSPDTRVALREFLAVAQDDGRALSAAALTQQLQRCKPHGREWTIAALRNSAHKRLAFVGEERANGNGSGRNGRRPQTDEELAARPGSSLDRVRDLRALTEGPGFDPFAKRTGA